MKKILIVLLALTCAFAMFSCGGSASIKDFEESINNTDPAAIELQITSDTAFGALSADFKTTFAEDGSFVIDGSYEKFNTTTEGASADVKTVVPVKITCDANGSYSDGGAFAGSNPAATGSKLVLNKKLNAEISKDGNVLTATVKAADTEAVFGVAYATDVALVITQNSGKIVSYTMEYATDYGYDRVVCNYQ